jgi:chemotaxis protein methyltransferase CheR
MSENIPSTLNTEKRNSLLNFIDKHTGMIFAPRLYNWIDKQVIDVFKESSSPNLNTFIDEILSGKNLIFTQKIIESLTVHETMFFRDKKYFEFIKAELIPKIIENNKFKKQIDIWISAGSSGQEAYSILFTLLEDFPELKNWMKTIYSTDISSKIIEKAKNAIYESHEINRGLEGMPHIKKYFEEQPNNKWQMKSEIRSQIRFKTSNLMETFHSMPNFDFISCRNVLIYFKDETKKDIVARLAEKVNKGGYLILGQVDYINKDVRPSTMEFKMRDSFPYLLK